MRIIPLSRPVPGTRPCGRLCDRPERRQRVSSSRSACRPCTKRDWQIVSWDTRISKSLEYSRTKRAVICCGDQQRFSPRSTSSRSRGQATSFDTFGRWARRCAFSSARHARYRKRAPPVATSRVTVEGERPRRVAIVRHESPAKSPREISSRSGNDSRRADRGVVRGFTPPVFRSNRCTDNVEQPIALAAARCVSPARTRCWSSTRWAEVSRCHGSAL